MRVLGFEISRKAAPPVPTLSTPTSGLGGSWFPIVREPFTGAWQRNIEIRADTALSNVIVFRCVNLIQSDIAKLRPRILEQAGEGPKAIWEEKTSPAFSPVLETPNRWQTRIQFWEQWISSKLNTGNTYVLKERDGRGLVVGMHILDPLRTKPLVADNGDVYYSLQADNLATVNEAVIVPAREIMHDRMNCWFHPLVGLSPLFAAGLAAAGALSIQQHSKYFFENGANPGGILTAPGRIDPQVAQRIKDTWQNEFTGSKVGRVAVLGDNLKYEPMMVNALNSQLIEQWRLTAEMITAAYGVPGYKVGAGSLPQRSRLSMAELDVQYYQQTLQIYIESAEAVLDQGLSLPSYYTVGFDLSGLLRMDFVHLVESIGKGVTAGFLAPNEGRAKLDLPPVEGGDTPYLQQQNFSLSALNRRDQEQPAPTPAAPGSAGSQQATEPDDGADDEEQDAEPGSARRLSQLVKASLAAADRYERRNAA